MLAVILTLLVVGVLMWTINTYVPLTPQFKQLINIVAILCVIFWLLGVFGILHYAQGIGVPKAH